MLKRFQAVAIKCQNSRNLIECERISASPVCDRYVIQ